MKPLNQYKTGQVSGKISIFMGFQGRSCFTDSSSICHNQYGRVVNQFPPFFRNPLQFSVPVIEFHFATAIAATAIAATAVAKTQFHIETMVYKSQVLKEQTCVPIRSGLGAVGLPGALARTGPRLFHHQLTLFPNLLLRLFRPCSRNSPHRMWRIRRIRKTQPVVEPFGKAGHHA